MMLIDLMEYLEIIGLNLALLWQKINFKIFIFALKMKLLANILLLTVTFLAFKPAVDYVVGIGCHEISCCVDECNPFAVDTNENELPADDCDGNSCNPFQVCGNSFVYAINEILIEDVKSTAFVQRQFSYEVNYASQFLPEFWQPPKIV